MSWTQGQTSSDVTDVNVDVMVLISMTEREAVPLRQREQEKVRENKCVVTPSSFFSLVVARLGQQCPTWIKNNK